MSADNNTKRFVISGTSGTGKTSLLDGLRRSGIACYEEAGRKVLTSGSQEAKMDAYTFVLEMLSHSKNDFHDACNHSVAIFDRGIPDTIAYAMRFKVDPTEFEAASRSHFYERSVFVTPPWQEIFKNDEVRTATFKEYSDFHLTIVNIYQKLGYSVVEVPKCSVQERVEFVRSTISLDT